MFIDSLHVIFDFFRAIMDPKSAYRYITRPNGGLFLGCGRGGKKKSKEPWQVYSFFTLVLVLKGKGRFFDDNEKAYPLEEGSYFLRMIGKPHRLVIDSQLFKERVYSDIRQMVRRDRNRPSVFLWEPILNETKYSEDFARNAFEAVRQEDPDRPFAADSNTPASEKCGVIYAHHIPEGEERPVLTREFGDGPDDWFNQSGRARLGYHQGEQAQRIQALNYHHPEKENLIYSHLSHIPSRPAQYLGAALWAGIECQRGYHPDPFYGGILGLHRQEKLSYYLFQSQKSPDEKVSPMVHIANKMTPSSPEDVTVYTNCEEVVLFLDRKEVGRQKPEILIDNLEHPPLTFSKAFTWTKTMERKHDLPQLKATGLIDGKEVCQHTIRRPGRKTALVIRPDFTRPPRAGGEVAPFFVEVVDHSGTVISGADEWIDVKVRGAGTLIGDKEDVFLNPVKVNAGSAPILVRTTPFGGLLTIEVKVKFHGAHTPKGDRYTLEIFPNHHTLCFDTSYAINTPAPLPEEGLEKEENVNTNWQEELHKVGRDQEAFADTTQSTEKVFNPKK